MSDQAQPATPTPGGLGSAFTRMPRKQASAPVAAKTAPATDADGVAASPVSPAAGPTRVGEQDRPGEVTPITPGAARSVERPTKRAATANKAQRGSPALVASAPTKASDTVAVLRRTLFLPDDVFDALALRRARTRLTNSTLVLLALDALHTSLPALVSAARRSEQFDSPSSLFGSMPVLTRVDGSGGRRQISVLWSAQVLDTVEQLVPASGAENRSQMIAIVLREWLHEELDSSEKS